MLAKTLTSIIFSLSLSFYFMVFSWGCTTVPSPVLTAEPPPNPALDTRTNRAEYFTSDGVKLGFVKYADESALSDTAIIFLNGLEGHAGWFKTSAEMFYERGFDVYSLDRRGSGMNREMRGFASGHIDSYETFFRDIRSFVLALRRRYSHLVLSGVSWGGKLALSYALAHPEEIEALVLVTPTLIYLGDFSPPTEFEIFLASLSDPIPYFNLPTESWMFADTKYYRRVVDEDPLRLSAASGEFFLQNKALDLFMLDNIGRNKLPIFLVLGAQDPVVDNDAVVSLLKKGTQQRLDIHTYENQKHAIQFQAPEELVADTINWLSKVFVRKLPQQ